MPSRLLTARNLLENDKKAKLFQKIQVLSQ